MPAGVYCIINLQTGQRYVGSTKDIAYRWYNHRSYLRGGKHENERLQADFNQYGESAFDFQVLEEVTDVRKLIEREQHYIDIVKPEYNMAPNAGSTKGMTYTQKSKRGGRRHEPGKTYEEYYGEEKSDEIKSKISEHSGFRDYNKERSKKGKTFEEIYGPDRAIVIKAKMTRAAKMNKGQVAKNRLALRAAVLGGRRQNLLSTVHGVSQNVGDSDGETTREEG